MQGFIFAAALMGASANALAYPRTVCGATSITDYKVANGDTLTTIAKKFNSGICDIASLNKLANPNFILDGQTLKIPQNCKTPDNDSCIDKVPDATETCVPGLGSVHIVRAKDTLTDIAASFNITLASVIAANKQIPNPDVIEIDQKITIPVCAHSGCSVKTYNIVSGDIFFDLAKTYHTTVGQILSVNIGVDPTKLEIGQQVILPYDCKNSTVGHL